MAVATTLRMGCSPTFTVERSHFVAAACASIRPAFTSHLKLISVSIGRPSNVLAHAFARGVVSPSTIAGCSVRQMSSASAAARLPGHPRLPLKPTEQTAPPM